MLLGFIQNKHVNLFLLFKISFECSFQGCNKTFSRQTYLDNHYDREHLGKCKKFECYFCNRTYTDRSNFGRHLRKNPTHRLENKKKNFNLECRYPGCGYFFFYN